MYPIDLHAHTIASTHAYSTLNEYLVEAHKKNLKLFAITDHGPAMADAPHPWHFMNMRIWPRIVNGVGILRGIEANIKNIAGEIDCQGIMLEQMDLVLAGFHEYVFPPKDCATHTETMINTFKNGSVHIISHPGNPSYPIDIKEVTKAAAKYNVALEINNSSFVHSRKGSKDNCLQIAQAVKEAGGWLSFGSDSHIALTLGEFDHCIEIVQQIDFPQDKILNTSPRHLLNFLEMRGKPAIAEFACF